MRQLILFLVLFFCLLRSFSQDSIVITGNFLNNTRYNNVTLKKFGLGIFDVTTSSINSETGKFTIKLPSDIQTGIYRLQYSQAEINKYLDIVLNGVDSLISFVYDVGLYAKSIYPVFTHSVENKNIYEILGQLDTLSRKIDISTLFLQQYPENKDVIYRQMIISRNEQIDSYKRLRLAALDSINYFWLRQVLAFTRSEFENPFDHPRLQRYNHQQVFWADKPTADTLLINTPLYTDAILQYLQYYLDPIMEFSEFERKEGFKKAVDTIVLKFSRNVKTREFAWKYLQLGFKEIGEEDILKYIDLKYAVKEQCVDGNIADSMLLERVKGYNSLMPGMNAPPISLMFEGEKSITFDSFLGKPILLVFWASWCPHCLEVMPRVNEWALTNPNNAVVAISLDYDKSQFSKEKKKYPAISHFSDFKQWDSPPVKSYFVSATPTFILLSVDRKIINKFSSFESFIHSLK